MTSPLQAAHDQAVNADPIVCTVAAPRQMAMSGVYTGAELRTRSSRPGAYDAMALPSLFNGRKRLPGDHETATPYVPREIAPQPLKISPRNSSDDPRTLTREFPTIHHPRGEYRPLAGSTPAKVLAHLRAMGGFLSHAEICERFDIKRSAITAAFKPILKHGVLVRQVVGGYTGFSLPGWSAPHAPSEPLQTAWRAEIDELHAVQAAGKGMPTAAEKLNIVFATGARDFLPPGNENRRWWAIPTTQDVSDGDPRDPVAQGALYELNLREAELGLLAGYIAVLQLRQQLFDAVRLFPLPPLTEPPRLTDAA